MANGSIAPEGRQENYRNALETIRRIAMLHYIGDAFEPEHMRTLANIAADALMDQLIPEPVSTEEIQRKATEWAEEYAQWVD